MHDEILLEGRAHEVAHDGFQRPVALVYSNRRPEDEAFLDELQALAQRHPAFRLVATMTDMAKSRGTWSGERRLAGKERASIKATSAARSFSGIERAHEPAGP